MIRVTVKIPVSQKYGQKKTNLTYADGSRHVPRDKKTNLTYANSSRHVPRDKWHQKIVFDNDSMQN